MRETTALKPGANVQPIEPAGDSVSTVDLDERTQTALTAADPDSRGEAIEDLSGVRTPHTVYVLSQALNDSTPRNRRLAIDSLRQLAANQGDGDGDIRSILRAAMHDSREDVAESAGRAYEEVIEIVGEP